MCHADIGPVIKIENKPLCGRPHGCHTGARHQRGVCVCAVTLCARSPSSGRYQKSSGAPVVTLLLNQFVRLTIKLYWWCLHWSIRFTGGIPAVLKRDHRTNVSARLPVASLSTLWFTCTHNSIYSDPFGRSCHLSTQISSA